MTIRTLSTIQGYFNTGDIPTETQFADSWQTAIVSDNVVGALSGAASPSSTNVFATSADTIGGSVASDALLKAWCESGAYELTAVAYHGTYTQAVASGTVKWPDGSAGLFTATAYNGTASPARVNAYTITHTSSSKTITQAACTVDSNGNITVKPALTVA